MNAMADMKKAAVQKTLETIEGQAGEMAPGPLKIMFPCCGGPVKTLKAFECAVPADKKEDFNKMFDQYTKAQEELKSM